MSIRTATVATLLFACLAGLAGCKEEAEKTARGSLGESCTRRQDCGNDLSCIDNRCVAESGSSSSDGGMPAATGGMKGETCTRRGDCQIGLACIDQVCQSDVMVSTGDAGVPSQRGERGETCTARNDCKSGLGCVSGRCRENDFNLTVQPKECFRVECEVAEDCCTNFVPQFNCASLKTSCDAGDALACSDYAQSCVCSFACEDSVCAFRNTCLTTPDCGSSQLKCVDKKCVQCAVKTDCLDPGDECVSGVCKEACTHNEQCPLFYACAEGKCVETGCKTDRECFFATDDPRSTCVEKECVTPCDTDSECSEAFNVCDKGRCVFAGCESNEECRAALNVENVIDGDKAVCRAPLP